MIKLKKLEYLYTLKEDCYLISGKTFDRDFYYADSTNKLWLKIRKDGILVIYKGYSWDGCTPKYSLGKVRVGIGDGMLISDLPITYYASLIHDVLYQFYDVGIPFTRKEVDDLFLRFIPEGFKSRYLYYWAVRIFGYSALSIRRLKKENKGKRLDHV